MGRESNEELIDCLQKDIERWEGQDIEFMEDYPSSASELSKEIAAFATSNAATIYLGVDKNKNIVGVSAIKNFGESQGKDSILDRLAGLTQKTIRPAINVTTDFIKVKEKIVVVKINVPKGVEPVYYSDDIPRIRNLTSSDRATPDQVKELVAKVTHRSIIRTHAKQMIISENEVKEVFGSEWGVLWQQTSTSKDIYVLNQFDTDFGGPWILLGKMLDYPKSRNILVAKIRVYDSVKHARKKHSETKHTYETSPGFAMCRVESSELGDFGIKLIKMADEIVYEHTAGYIFVQNNVLVELILEWEISGDIKKLQKKLTPVGEIRFLTLARIQESKIYEFL